MNRKSAPTHYVVRERSLVKIDRAGRDKYVDGTVIRFNKKWRGIRIPLVTSSVTPSRYVMSPCVILSDV